MASLTKRKIKSSKYPGTVTSRVYYITWYENKRKRFLSTGEVTRPAAEEFFRKWKADRLQMVRNISLKEFSTEIQKYVMNNYRRSTYLIYRSTLNRFLEYVKDKPLKLIHIKDIESYKLFRLYPGSATAETKQSISNTSMNIEIRTLKAAFNMAVEFGYLGFNPIRKAKQLEVPERELNTFTDVQVNLLIANSINSVLHKVIVIAAHSGMRLAEIVNLKFKHLDFQGREVRILNDANFKTKTGRKRTIYMADEVLNLFHSNNVSTLYEPENYVLGKLYDKSYITRRFINLCRKLGFPPELHFHSLRHTFASKLAGNGTDLNTLKEILGHSTIKTTEIYLHGKREEKRKAMTNLRYIK